VREPFVLDVAKHRPEGGDADPAGDEDECTRRVLGKHERPSRGLDLDLRAHGKLNERAFEGAVADAGAETDDPRSVGEVTAEMWRREPFSSSYGGSRSSTQKYWPGRYSNCSPCKSKTTSSVPFATSRFSLIVARTAAVTDPKLT
jgi:hypothetical protein